MRTIYILRHARADFPPGIEDRDRPLAERGREDAEEVAGWMVEKGYRPGSVICSPARRTRQTLKPVLAAWPDLAVSYNDNIYNATVGDLFEALKDVPDSVSSILLVGHNPGIHGLAQLLAGDGEPALLARIAGGYQPGCLAVLRCDCKRWEDLQPGAARLEDLFGA